MRILFAHMLAVRNFVSHNDVVEAKIRGRSMWHMRNDERIGRAARLVNKNNVSNLKN